MWCSHDEACPTTKRVALEQAVRMRSAGSACQSIRSTHGEFIKTRRQTPRGIQNSFHLYYTNVYFENNADTLHATLREAAARPSDPAPLTAESAPDYDPKREEPLTVDVRSKLTNTVHFGYLGPTKP
jgi:hypothetical protein